MTPERSYPLHNFNLPSRLRWGTQRHMRCKKQESEPQRSDAGGPVEAIDEKLMLDYKLRMDRIKVVVGDVEEKEKVVVGDGVELSKPWNLRTRRSPEAVGRWVRGGSLEEKVEFRVPLKREEVEMDFLMMCGVKPPRRPKKRSRVVQKDLDNLFPGVWLTEATPEMYDVPEATES